MPQSHVTSRRAVTVTGLLAALLLSACSGADTDESTPQAGGESAGGVAQTRVVSTEQGDVEIPADPQKVVVLNPALTGYFYAVDTSVHAAVPLNTDASEFPASYAEEAEADGTQFVPWSNDGFDLEYEPTTFLDLAHQVEVLDLVDRLRSRGRTVVAVLHELNLAARYATHLVAMREGSVVAQGRPSEVVTADLVEQVFGLRCRILVDPLHGVPVVLPG